MAKNKYLIDMDKMKAVTIILVVLGHVTRMFGPHGAVNIKMQSNTLNVFTEFVYMFHMPAFIAISGAVYFFVKREKNRYKDSKKFILNKFVRILVPYLFFASVVVLPALLYIGKVDNITTFIVKNIFLFSGPSHLWYSVAIFNIFIIFNLFEEKIYSLNFVIGCIFFVVIHGIGTKTPPYFQINSAFLYMVYFYLGYSFQRYKYIINKYLSSNVFLIVMIALTCGLFYLHYDVVAQSSFVLRVPVRIVGASAGTAMLYMLASRLTFVPRKLIADSYGLYLFHPMIIYILFYWLRDKEYNVYLVSLIVFTLATLISLFMINIFRILGLHILIGEQKVVKDRVKSSKLIKG